MKAIGGRATGPNLLDTYSERAVACTDMCHFVALYFLMWLVEKQSDRYPGRDVKELYIHLGLAIAIALEATVIKPGPDAPADAAP